MLMQNTCTVCRTVRIHANGRLFYLKVLRSTLLRYVWYALALSYSTLQIFLPVRPSPARDFLIFVRVRHRIKRLCLFFISFRFHIYRYSSNYSLLETEKQFLLLPIHCGVVLYTYRHDRSQEMRYR